MSIQFNEILNDLVNYFFLGDLLLLQDWKQEHHLSDQLSMEFTTNESADLAMEEGIFLPMYGIENYPYTILFTFETEPAQLLKKENRLQFCYDDYSIKVAHHELMLYTWPLLTDFTPEHVDAWINQGKQRGKAIIELDNGWYHVTVLGGECLKAEVWEPTLEFILQRIDQQREGNGNPNANFRIHSSTYGVEIGME